MTNGHSTLTGYGFQPGQLIQVSAPRPNVGKVCGFDELADLIDAGEFERADAWIVTQPILEEGTTGAAGRAQDSDVREIQNLYADLDVKNAPRGVAQLEEVIDALSSVLGVRPTMVVASSGANGGRQPHWTLDTSMTFEVLKHWGSLVQRIAAERGVADNDNVWNASRLMRLPNSRNMKKAYGPEGAKVYVTERNEGKFIPAEALNNVILAEPVNAVLSDSNGGSGAARRPVTYQAANERLKATEGEKMDDAMASTLRRIQDDARRRLDEGDEGSHEVWRDYAMALVNQAADSHGLAEAVEAFRGEFCISEEYSRYWETHIATAFSVQREPSIVTDFGNPDADLKIAEAVTKGETPTDLVHADEDDTRLGEFLLEHGINRLYRKVTSRKAQNEYFVKYSGKVWESCSEGDLRHSVRRALKAIYLAKDEAFTADVKRREDTDEEFKPQEIKERRRQLAQLLSTSKVNAVFSGMKDSIPVKLEDFDTHPYKLNLQNGTYNLETLELEPHSPEDMLTQISPVEYREGAKSERWETFISEVLPGEGLAGFLQRYQGMSLVGKTLEECLVIAKGSGRNGKGVFVETVQKALGDYAMASNPSVLMRKAEALSAGDLDELFSYRGARSVFMSELESTEHLNESLLKRFTGGDTLRSKPMFGHMVEWTPTHSIMMITNAMPQYDSSSEALNSRLKVLDFAVSFIGREDKTLKADLRTTESLEAVLAWMIEGWKSYKEIGLSEPEAVKLATEREGMSADPTGEFISEMCSIGKGARVGQTPLFEAYEKWADDNAVDKLRRIEFKRYVSKLHGVDGSRKAKIEGKSVPAWHGITLNSDAQVEFADEDLDDLLS